MAFVPMRALPLGDGRRELCTTCVPAPESVSRRSLVIRALCSQPSVIWLSMCTSVHHGTRCQQSVGN
ncbi:hypothetical protein EJF18_80077 [Clavispora lusitaniae]|uniref:Uncharacterized protein n=1 Tax=Clavispora lusitaniae TaxID=36911 RepID=A0ACD0WS23_CLALS|nr:hypothetical protein FOB63_004427 [Clavispora lusitaniae]QFZ30362.1 hypothetical protein EJF14_80077 [Clavispora lusitaniae]QFZ36024.1 hypothetical protein EJF16_80077 [Clavispora lusitaniae]QFZ41708.1 hypothetical protein EJF15_80077 [Clavispora lusitaniae]QFZ47384.1 hypothetical protein EJF18_80077 [Clavispora lusitaniae]